MAFGPNIIWHNWASGNTGNGGGFDPGFASFATDLACDAGTGLTASPVVGTPSYSFVAADVGHWLFLQQGSGWTPGWYQVGSVAGGKATLLAGVGQAVLCGTDPTDLRTYRKPAGLNTAAGLGSDAPTAGTWSVDYSQSANPRYSFTDMKTHSTYTDRFSSAAAGQFYANLLGNIVSVNSGSFWTVQRVQIIAASGLYATGDKPWSQYTSTTGGVGKLGGAVGGSNSLLGLSLPLAAGGKVYLKGSYSLAAVATMAGSGGSSSTGYASVEGFAAWPGDRGWPVVTASASNLRLINASSAGYVEFVGIDFRGGTNTFSAVQNLGGNCCFRDCKFTGFTTSAVESNNGCVFVGGEIVSCNIALSVPTSQSYYVFGVSFRQNGASNNGDIFLGGDSSLTLEDCGFDGSVGDCIVDIGAVYLHLKRNTFTAAVNGYRDARGGAGTPTSLTLCDNLFYTPGGVGMLFGTFVAGINTGGTVLLNRSNAYGPNPANARRNLPSGYCDLLFTANPFTNLAGHDLSLNQDPAGGGLLRAKAFPTLLGGNTNYRDVGALQSQGGGAAAPGPTYHSH